MNIDLVTLDRAQTGAKVTIPEVMINHVLQETIIILQVRDLHQLLKEVDLQVAQLKLQMQDTQVKNVELIF